MSVRGRRAWAERVMKDLLRELDGVDQVVVMAGARYREFLVGSISVRARTVVVPIKNRESTDDCNG